jgi:hypothetical protein
MVSHYAHYLLDGNEDERGPRTRTQIFQRNTTPRVLPQHAK